jgi:hypothetical protein
MLYNDTGISNLVEGTMLMLDRDGTEIPCEPPTGEPEALVLAQQLIDDALVIAQTAERIAYAAQRRQTIHTTRSALATATARRKGLDPWPTRF